MWIYVDRLVDVDVDKDVVLEVCLIDNFIFLFFKKKLYLKLFVREISNFGFNFIFKCRNIVMLYV